MMDFLRTHRYKIFLFLMVVFLLGTFVGFGGYVFTGQAGPGDAIAEVNGEEIPLRIFLSHHRRAMQQVPPDKATDKGVIQQKRDETLRDLIQSMVFFNEAKRYGIQVPDQQVAMSLTEVPAFQEKGAFSPRLYMQMLQSQMRLSPQDFEEEQRKSIAFFKLRWLIQSCITVTDKEFEMLAEARQPGKLPKTAKEKSELRNQIWQEKVLYSLNQWFGQLGSALQVKTHFELLEGGR